MESYESVLLVKPEVFVFMIPPRTTNRGYRAADWNLSDPTWTGRLRLITKDGKCSIKLEDKTKGELFAECPIETYPGVAIEPVMDSSRYFVLRIQDDNGRTAFIGLGFGDRSDSFDLNVALQDHFKWVKKEQQFETESNAPELDLRFKEGETIKINMKITKKDGSDGGSGSTGGKAKNKLGAGGGSIGVLAPPPQTAAAAGGSSNKIAPPPSTSVTPTVSPSHHPPPPAATSATAQNSNWSEFMSGDVNQVTPASTSSTDNWVQF